MKIAVMSSLSDFDCAVAYWSFGWLRSDELPGVAVEALSKGIDGPTLLQLASARPEADPDLHQLFERALVELGRSRMTKPDAGRLIAQDLARSVSEGRLTPVDGAAAIWRVSLECEELSGELGIFGGLVSDYEGLPEVRDRITEQIVIEAKELAGLA